MSDKKLNAIKEIEFRIQATKEHCTSAWDETNDENILRDHLNDIDTLLFDINDFINDLKDTNETN